MTSYSNRDIVRQTAAPRPCVPKTPKTVHSGIYVSLPASPTANCLSSTATTMSDDNDVDKEKLKGNDGRQVEKKTDTSGNPSLMDKLKAYLPPWVTAALTNPRAWKTLARCWLASWATFLLLLPHNSLKALGNAYVPLLSQL